MAGTLWEESTGDFPSQKVSIAETVSMSRCYCGPTTNYRQTSNIKRTFVGNLIVDHSDVVGALPVGAAPTTSSFST